jgi:hypothetical protein
MRGKRTESLRRDVPAAVMLGELRNEQSVVAGRYVLEPPQASRFCRALNLIIFSQAVPGTCQRTVDC